VSATELSKSRNPKGFAQTKDVTVAGGRIAAMQGKNWNDSLDTASCHQPM